MRISPHLVFDGRCRAAFTRYHEVLGGELFMLTFRDSPMAAEVEPRWHDRIVHATLDLGGSELAGADVLPRDFARPQGFAVLLTVEDLGRAEAVFSGLARGGEVRCPLQATFWSPGFGVLVDPFGVPWEVSCASPPSP